MIRALRLCLFTLSSVGFGGFAPELRDVHQGDVVRLEKRSLDVPQKYPDELQYGLSLEGKNYTVHLEKNRVFLGKSYTVTHYAEDGTMVKTTPEIWDHCYYHGHIHGLKDSSVSVGLCSGMQGFMKAEQHVYMIEPLQGSVDGDHAVYRQKHLRHRRDQSWLNDFVYSMIPKPAGVKSQVKLSTQRYVEMVMVVDNTEYRKHGRKKIEERMMGVANHIDKLYRPMNIRVMLVGLELWSHVDLIQVSSNPNITLQNFIQWRQDSLLKRKRHDNAQLVTGQDFDGTTVGLAYISAMCSDRSGAVNQDHHENAITLASTIAHEMGHNLGMLHDYQDCICAKSMFDKSCVMAESVGAPYPDQFSVCSKQSYQKFLEDYNPSCLLDNPGTEQLFGPPVCGNVFVEPGEECDCGTVEECTNPCCNATNCRLTEGSQCAQGECCKNCQLKPVGTVCRVAADDCDLSELCSGKSSDCPKDTFKMNGSPCNQDRGYCYNGQCPSHQDQCSRLWGKDAKVAAGQCFTKNSNCPFYNYQRCDKRHAMCGVLYCSGGKDLPITNRMKYFLMAGARCNEAVDASGDSGKVPTGTKCGSNMVCFNSLCQNVSVYENTGCSAKCNNHGVCNHENRCQCEAGWAPPYCAEELGTSESGQAMVIGVSVAVVGLCLFTLIIGRYRMCYRRPVIPTKRFRRGRLFSGQSNPVFQPSNARNNPQCGPPTISQPTFVASSSTQACTLLTVAPSHDAPEGPPSSERTSGLIYAIPVRPQFSQCLPQLPANKPLPPPSKPLPPSRPLPPLNVKLVIASQKVALIPPKGPR
ncbi:disintegrin and metalloproteinase domain-containing protein 8a isoform X2 [Denticeps clupeoides]|uniref:disintegrin and metalloproteinase domain-containing protein 8a isoform X2 n=1 Tax=Denticeps clupeoides TaxID=299321 RepID=UPI0010A4D85F|nr:disintegrin and metalloproteinase domain-containing protein 8 isoform X2 [Denticeps clupeoides]